MIPIPLKDGTEYQPTTDFLQALKETYPTIDLIDQFKKMRMWCLSNDSKRKTRRGIKRFINSWLNRYETNQRIPEQTYRNASERYASNTLPSITPSPVDLRQASSQVWQPMDITMDRSPHSPPGAGGVVGKTLEIPARSSEVDNRALERRMAPDATSDFDLIFEQTRT